MLVRHVRDKHSSLLSINYGCKFFYSTGPAVFVENENRQNLPSEHGHFMKSFQLVRKGRGSLFFARDCIIQIRGQFLVFFTQIKVFQKHFRSEQVSNDT